MQRHSSFVRFSFVFFLSLLMSLAARPLAAQTDDDDAALRPAEPDFKVINIPTTLPLPLHGSSFNLTHRFGENLRTDSFSKQASNLFGIDQGATIQFEYRFGVFKHLEAVAARTNFAKTLQLEARYDAMHQTAGRPFGLSGFVSVEGGDNFQQDYKPALGVSLSHLFGERAAVYAAPVWVHNSAAGTGTTRDTGYIGLGARVAFLPTAYLLGEVTPRVGGYGPGDPEFAFGIEKRVGGHVFSLVFANTPGTTFGQLATGGFPKNLQMGFNLTRKFF